MTPIQQLMLGVGASKKTYMDDVFSTYLYTGNATARSINNGIDLAGEGGMVWTKCRSNSNNHYKFDTVRGATKYIKSNQSNAEGNDSNTLTSFNNNGFSLGTDSSSNESGRTFSSWTFRKAPGFFDVVQYTGNGSNRTIAHSLGSIPGFILIKGTSDANSWYVYHRSVGAEKYLRLNATDAETDQAWFMNDTEPTASAFSLGTSSNVNGSGQTYVAYVFAGGESTAATARSVDVDSGDYLSIPDDTGWALGQTWTIEAWVNPDSLGSSYNTVVAQDGNWYFSVLANGTCQMNGGGGTHDSASGVIKANTWTHMAYVSNSGTGQWYINGVASGSTASKNITDTSGTLYIGNQTGSDWPWDGKISNLRIVKGTAVYTSSFRLPTEPLTNITNTVLLCCNNSSVTGSTVSPGTITNSSTTASTDSPFDDPAAFTFGDSKEGIIKCGSYIGNGSTDGTEVNLGWEPQYVMIKSTTNGVSESWIKFDSMRGMPTGAKDYYSFADKMNAEADDELINLTPTGFKLTKNHGDTNTDAINYLYIAIRRADGYVGKPAELGTDVFAMDTGAGAGAAFGFDSGFPVDLALRKQPASTDDWYIYPRLITGKALKTNSTASESAEAEIFDSNVGWAYDYGSNYQAFMWKRHAGFDVVCYGPSTGTAGLTFQHSLGKIPEMIWIKSRSSRDWACYHKGLNGGTNPEQYYLLLNEDQAEVDSNGYWNDTAPTSTTVTLGSYHPVNSSDNHNYIAMLFASVDGISKVGSYTGNGSSGQTITLGFQPRFLIIKPLHSDPWWVLDTTRGWGSGNDKYLKLDQNAAQADYNFGAPTSTGFTLVDGNSSYNGNANKYIYYAHA